MTQAISAVGLQLKSKPTLQKAGAGTIAFAGSPQTPARNASNSNSVSMIALIGLGIAAVAAAIGGLIYYFKGGKKSANESA